MDLDEFFNKHAEFGYYQKQYFVLLAGMQIFGAFHNIHNTFIGAEPEFYCMQGGKRGGCPVEGTCEKYVYPGKDFTSIASEFNLVCDESYKANLVQSIYMACLLPGSVFFGKIADTYGRKMTTIVAVVGMAATSAVGMFSTSYSMYVICRALSAFCNGGWGLVSFVYLTEMVGSSKRGLAGIVVPACFAFGIMVYAVLAYYIRDWRLLTLFTSLPGFIGIYFIWFFVESPRWLYSKGRIAEAEAIANYIMRKNNRGSCNTDPIQLKNPLKDPIVTEVKNNTIKLPPGSSDHRISERTDRFSDLFRVPALRNRTMNNVYTWFVNCCVYYGLTMGLGNLGGSIYVSVALSGVVEIPAYILALYLIESRLGRKYTYSLSMLFGGAVCISIIIIPTKAVMMRSAAALCGKMAISLSFCVAWLYSAEMYPTSLRNQGVSLCTGASRVGGMISPLLMQLSRKYPYSDFVTFGVLTFIAGLLALRLPETHNKPLPECVADVLSPRGAARTAGTDRAGPRDMRVTPLSEDKVRLLQEEIEDNQSEEV